MDLYSILNSSNGFVEKPNPKYNPKSKKNTEPPTIKVPITGDATSSIAGFAEAAATHATAPYTQEESAPYEKYNIAYNPNKNKRELVKLLDSNQSNLSKIWNAVVQAGVNEFALGSVKAISDITDYFINGFNTSEDADYTNPVSSYLAELQEKVKEAAPIYYDQSKHINNGGLLDVGYIASNIPSLATSLSLLIPGKLFTGGLKYLITLSGASKFIGNTRRAFTGLKGIENLNRLEQAKKLEGLTKAQRFINGKGTQLANTVIENGATAYFMRLGENYQESQQVYQDMYKDALNRFNSMTDEEWDAYIKDHPELGDANIDRNNAAKHLAKQSADVTFDLDKWNGIFDFIELCALRNVGKLPESTRLSYAAAKAARLEKEAAAKAAGIISQDSAKGLLTRSLKSIKNFTSDISDSALSTGGVLFSQISEGLEEGVNYIAQQEGYHYGNVILGKENPSFFVNRLKSYRNSPELYDSMFWGFVGGVTFTLGAPVAQHVYNKTVEKAISSVNDKNDKNKDKTKEKSTSWSEDWEFSTTKRQKEEINKRVSSAQQYRQKIQDIESGKNIYETQEDGRTPKIITSPEEKEALKARARREYAVELALRAVDAGTYDNAISFVQDQNVRKMLEQYGLTEDGGADIARYMEESVKEYQNNLLLVNTISGSIKGGVPLEYQYIMARDNTLANLNVKALNEQLSLSEENAANHRLNTYRRSLETAGYNADDDTDYRHSVFLVEASKRLGQLQAQLNSILNSEEADSVVAQQAIRQLDRQIDAINAEIASIYQNDSIGATAGLIWAHINASQYVYDENTGLRVDTNNDKYIGLLETLNAVQSGADVNKNFTQLLSNIFTPSLSSTKTNRRVWYGVKQDPFAFTDDQITALFGTSDSTNGAFNKLNDNLRKHYQDQSEENTTNLKKVAKALYDEYVRMSDLRLAKIYQESLLNTDIQNISKSVQELNNERNKVRVKAIQQAEKTLIEAARKYGYDEVLDFVYNYKGESSNPDFINNDKEKEELKDALIVLNLTNEANISLLDDIHLKFAYDERYRGKQNEETTNGRSQTSVSQENSSEQSQNQSSNNPSQEQQNKNVGQERGQNADISATEASQNGQEQNPVGITVDTTDSAPEPTPETPEPAEDKNGKLQLEVDLNGNLTAQLVADTDSNPGVNYTQTANDVITPQFKGNEEQVSNLSLETRNALFDVVETDEPIVEVTSNPKIQQGENGALTIVEKGEIKLPKAKDSSTGEEEQTPTPISEDSEDDKNTDVESNVSAQDIMLMDHHQALGSALFEKYYELKELGVDRRAALDKALEEIKKDPSYNEQTDSKAVEVTYKQLQAMIDLAEGKTPTGTEEEVAGKQAILYSTATENITKDLTNLIGTIDEVVKKFIDAYAKANDVLMIDGKYYINLEDLLSFVKNQYNTPYHATSMFDTLKKYIKNHENEYVVTDNDLSYKEIIDKVLICRSRTEKNIGIFRVSTDELFRNETLEFVKEFNNLRRGDKLTIVKGKNVLYIKSNGITVGKMPVVTRTTTGYEQVNMNWITNVSKENGTVQSPLLNALNDLLTVSEYEALRDKILKYTYDNLSVTDKEQLAKEIFEELNSFTQFEKLIKNKIGVEKTTVDFIANTFKYYTVNGNVKNKYKVKNIIKTLQTLFDKYYEEYELIDNIYNGNANVEFEVANIVEGHINEQELEAQEGLTKHDNYDNLEYAHVAVDKEHKQNNDRHFCHVGHVDEKGHNIITKEGSISRTNLTPGTPFLIMSNGTNVEHIFGNAVRFNDRGNHGLTPIFKAIDKEFKTLFNKLRNASSEEEQKDAQLAISQFLYRLTGKRNAKYWPDAGNKHVNKTNKLYPKVTPLLYGAYWSNISGYVHIESSGYNIQFNNDGTIKIQSITKDENGNIIRKDVYAGSSSTKEGIDTLTNTINTILNNTCFNISSEFVQSVANQDKNNLWSTDVDGTFRISIPDSSSNKGNFTVESKDFNTFVLETGCIKVNTHVSTREVPDRKGKSHTIESNFHPKAQNQRSNRRLEVRAIEKKSSPVEEVKGMATVSETEVRNILTDDSNENKVEELVAKGYGEETLNSLKMFSLLPENIIFAENFNAQQNLDRTSVFVGDNAKTTFTTNPFTGEVTTTVTVGNKWISMFAETRNYAGAQGKARLHAIRKLIHEQLHVLLHQQDNLEHTRNDKDGNPIYEPKQFKQLKSIYDEFVKSLSDKENVDKFVKWLMENHSDVYDTEEKARNHVKHLEIYIFDGKDKAVNEHIEEFIVESLTSQELAEYLNQVDSKNKLKNVEGNLWKRIMKFLSELLGIDIRKGSLYEKELFALQKKLSKPGSRQTTNKKQTSKKKENDGQLELNFDEPVNKDSNNVVNEDVQQVETNETTENEQQPSVDVTSLDFLLGNVTDAKSRWSKSDVNEDSISQKDSSTTDNNIRNSSVDEDVVYPTPDLLATTDGLSVENQGIFLSAVLNGEFETHC